MINNNKITLSYCCDDIKSHPSGGDNVLLNLLSHRNIVHILPNSNFQHSIEDMRVC